MLTKPEVFNWNSKIRIEDNIKYLGIIIDNKLRIARHVDCICKQLAEKLKF